MSTICSTAARRSIHMANATRGSAWLNSRKIIVSVGVVLPDAGQVHTTNP